MPDVRTFGPVGSTINLRDTAKYRIPVGSERENRIFAEEWSPVRNNNTINLGLADLVAVELIFDVWVTGATWQAVLTNYDAIKTMAETTAPAFSIAGTGTVVQYIEQDSDQSSPTTYAVKRGRFAEQRPRRSVQNLRKVGTLTLLCEPL